MGKGTGRGLRRVPLYAVVVLIASATVAGQQVPDIVARNGYADAIMLNGKIVSMADGSKNSETGPTYQAIAIKGDKIMKLGTNEEIKALAADFTKTYDLKGRTMIPGIVEPHQHIYGRSFRWLDRFGIKFPPNGVVIRPQATAELESTQRVLRDSITDALKGMKPGDWLMVDMRAHPDNPAELDLWGDTRRLTNRKTLDMFSDKNPVVVAPGNRGFLNTQALNLMNGFLPGYSDSINESMHSDEIGVEASEIGWVGSKEMGVIEWELFLKDIEPNTLAEMLRLESEAWASLGVTTFGSRIEFPKIMTGYARLTELGKMPIRFAAHYEVHRLPTDPKETRQFYRRTGVLQGIGNDFFWFDGVASERWDSHHPEACTGDDTKATPALKARETCPKKGDLHWDVLTNAIRAGWRLKGIHSVGSQALNSFMDMIDGAIEGTGITLDEIREEHFAVEHCDMIGKDPKLLERVKRYGIIMSCGPDLLHNAAQTVRDYGPYNDWKHLSSFFMPFKTWIEQDVNIVGQHFGGASFVGGGGEGRVGGGRQTPFFMPWLTMTRVVDGWIWDPEERIDRVRALKLYTRWASRYVMREDKVGSIEEGKYADLLILDRDYFTIPENDILKIRPLMTMTGGNIVSLNASLAEEWKMPPVGFQFNFEDKEIEWAIKMAETAKPWRGEPLK